MMHVVRRAAVGVVLLTLASSVGGAQSPRPQAPAVAAGRAARLRHGVNLSDWLRVLADGRSYTKEQFDAAITAQDLTLIRDMGFDHVRLCVNPQPLFRPLQADRIPPESLAYLDKAVQMILDAGLAVQLDIQADDAFKRRLSDDAFVEQFADFWRALAKHYASTDPERVFFEVLNEPELRDPYRWYGIEDKLVNAIRDSAPSHTVIVTGARFSDEDDLVFLDPLRDPNVIYAFHFYQPFLFTHQGATWAENFWHFLQGVPYPSRPDAAEQAAAAVPDPVHRLAVIRYGVSHWDAARIDLEIRQVSDWARRWGVTVICNEFGAYRLSAPPADRVAWLTDTRTALEHYGIGWTLWEYSGGFGVVTKDRGETSPDAATLTALARLLPAREVHADRRTPQ